MNTVSRRAKLGLVSLICVAAAVMPARAMAAAPTATEDEDVVSITITSDASQIVLDFKEPVTEETAEEVIEDVAEPGDVVEVTTEDEPPAVAGAGSLPARRAAPPLGCGNQRVNSDSNGRLTLDYRCDLTPKRLQWSYKLSTAVQSIVVGNVNETGLRWWKNGVAQPQNAPHTVPASYLFHGTMNPTPIGSTVQFQDYMTFRHNVGSGGTGSVTWAGSAELTRTLP